MSFLPSMRTFCVPLKYTGKYIKHFSIPVRNLVSKQLVYSEFGDPLHVIKIRECEVPQLQPQDVLVRMLAAPVNPADINTIQGITKNLPTLPWVGGDEGVGNVVETGSLVCRVQTGQRVIFTKRNLGTWRHYGIYNERDLHVISPKIPLADASMLSLAPCLAYRLLKDFRAVRPMQSIIQNAANSPCGQCVIQMCKAWGIDTFNIVASHYAFKDVKEYLLKIGATAVFTLEEAEELLAFNTSLSRPVLALNCLGGRYEDAMLKLLEKCGDIVYYGCSYELPLRKQKLRKDAKFHKFSLDAWKNCTTTVQHDIMLKEIINLMVSGHLKPPMYIPVELKNYTHVMRETAHCEAFAISNYVFDFTI